MDQVEDLFEGISPAYGGTRRARGGIAASFVVSAALGALCATAVGRAAEPACISMSDRVEGDAELSAIAGSGDDAHWVMVKDGEIAYRRFQPATGWGARIVLASGASYETPVIAAADSGVVRAAWIELDASGQSDVRLLTLTGGVPVSAPIVVGPTPGQDRQLSLATNGSDVWLVWISDEDQAEVYVAHVDDAGQPGIPVNLSETQSNDWAPDATLTSDGALHVVWDSYLADDYDVLYRRYDPSTGAGALEAVATGSPFQAHASIVADESDRLWVAWEEAPASWGKGATGNWKDWTPENSARGALHSSRSLHLAMYDPAAGTLSLPSIALDDYLTTHFVSARGSDYPQHDALSLVRKDGSTWILFRYAVDNTDRERWDVYVTAVDDAGWREVATLCDSGGFLYQQGALVDGTAGPWVAGGLVGDNDSGVTYAGRFPGLALQTESALTWTSVAAPTVPEAVARTHASNSIRVDGTTYTTVWGDLHRHTEVSTDSRWGHDGTVEELYRYAIDVAKLQFVAQTDHEYSQMERHYPRMFQQTELHTSPTFAPLYGLEWTARKTGPVSHHNVISRARHPYPTEPAPPPQDELTDLHALFDTLVPGTSIAIPHTTAEDANDDLQDWALLKQEGLVSPTFHRVVEIYQGSRTAYEDVGAPAPFGEDTAHLAPAGTTRTMLEQDIRMGFIASSDHRSNFLSYAVVYSDALDRDAIFSGLDARRTYASTSRDLILEFWVADRPMGEEITVPGPAVEIRARADVAGALGNVAIVDILKDGAVWQTVTPGSQTFTGTWNDPDACGHNYYVRVRFSDEARDGHMGWSSPVWVGCAAPEPPELWVAFATTTTVPALGSVRNEDVVAYSPDTGAWSMVFDGSDVGLDGLAIDGLARLPSGEILLSFTASGTVPGLLDGPDGTLVDDSDIVRFVPTSLGDTTAGTFYFYFDGSDVGLTSNAEDIDAIAIDSDGKLLVSTTGKFTGTGATGNDEDLFAFTPTLLGVVTEGTFALHFDGSDVGLATTSGENVDAAAVLPSGRLLLSTVGDFSVAGATGADEDALAFDPSSLGTTTAGTFSLYLDLSSIGIDPSEDVAALEWKE